MDKWIREMYKSKGSFGNSLDSRRSSLLNNRKEKRNNILGKFRNIPENMSPVTPMVSKVQSKNDTISNESKPEKKSTKRMEMLKKWKEERDKRKMEEKKKTKAPFKVCHVNHTDDLEKVLKTIKGKPIDPKKVTIDPPKKTEPKNTKSKSKEPTDILVRSKTRSGATASSTYKGSLRSQQKPVEETKKVPVKLQKERLAEGTLKNTKNNAESKKKSKVSKPDKNGLSKTAKKVMSEQNKDVESDLQTEKNEIKDAIDSNTATSQEMENKVSGLKKTPNKRRKSRRISTVTSEDKENDKLTTLSANAQSETRNSEKTTGKVASRKKSTGKVTNMDSDQKTSTEDSNVPKQNYVTPVKAKSRRKWAKSENFGVDCEIGADGDELKESDDFGTPVGPENAKEAEICYVSPFVTMSRGKRAARKEYEKRKSGNAMDMSLSSLDPRSPKAAADYFTIVLRRETERIEDMCKTWQDYKDENNLGEDARGLIDMTIGQSNLLITKKFEQFRGLVDRCRSQETSADGMRIQCEDLHGFWDMVYRQVGDLERRFENLEDMRRNDWLEAEPKKKTPKKRVGGRKKVAKGAKKATSSLREKIAAARKNNTKLNQDGDIEIVFAKKESTPRRASKNGKELSTPARGILKAASVKSEKIKSVAFQIPRENGDANERLSMSGGFRSTPLNKRRSSRISLNRGKLFY